MEYFKMDATGFKTTSEKIFETSKIKIFFICVITFNPSVNNSRGLALPLTEPCSSKATGDDCRSTLV